MVEVPKITMGPVELIYKGKRVQVTEEFMRFYEGWVTAVNAENERHKKAMSKLESDLDRVIGVC